MTDVRWRGMDLNHQPRAYESPALPLSYLAGLGGRFQVRDRHYMRKVEGVNGIIFARFAR